MPTFNLIDEPWIPCLAAAERSNELLSLRETLARAPDLVEINGDSPLVTIGLHRLLLALLHRNFGPSSAAEWIRIWDGRTWDTERLDEYFAIWRHRFDLFDAEWPFYQAGRLDFKYEATIARLRHDLASGNNATLFDHSLDDAAVAVAPARAARDLVAYQAFAVGGRITFEPGHTQDGSADAAPLSRGALVLVKGRSLFETLMLALVPYNRADALPFEFEAGAEDLPVWERGTPTVAADRRPVGYIDLLTWPSRRIRLHPEVDGEGRTVVRRVVIMKGNQFPGGWTRFGKETMVAFTRQEKPGRNPDPWPVVGLREDRALWRDSLALLQSVEATRARPKTMDWLGQLVFEHGALDRAQTLPLEVFGLCGERAKVLLWRHERLPLPLTYLNSPELLGRLDEALGLTERTAAVLRASAWRLACLLLAPDSDDQGGRQADRKAIAALTDRLRLGQAYWSKLDVTFRRFLIELAADQEEDEDGELVHGRRALPEWAASLRATAWAALREATDGLDGSGRALKAVASGERELARGLERELGTTLRQAERNPQ